MLISAEWGVRRAIAYITSQVQLLNWTRGKWIAAGGTAEQQSLCTILNSHRIQTFAFTESRTADCCDAVRNVQSGYAAAAVESIIPD